MITVQTDRIPIEIFLRNWSMLCSSFFAHFLKQANLRLEKALMVYFKIIFIIFASSVILISTKLIIDGDLETNPTPACLVEKTVSC